MAPGDSKRSKRSKKKPTSGKQKTNDSGREREKGPTGFQRIDTGMEKLPSNAPTMAIAPSDYEHIFHEATAQPEPSAKPVITAPKTVQTPSPPPPPLIIPKPRTPEPLIVAQVEGTKTNQALSASYNHPLQLGTDIHVTPDGYTLLGQLPDGRRIPLPPYVVRANNQFSRPVLAKVGRYLLSRIELPR